MIGYALNLKLKTFVLVSVSVIFCLFCTVLYIPIFQVFFTNVIPYQLYILNDFQGNILNPNHEEEAPILLWWTPFVPNDHFITCPKNKCFVTPNRLFANNSNLKVSCLLHLFPFIILMLQALLFYGSSFKPYDIPISDRNKIPWAIFHEESPKNLAFFLYHEGQKLFNITATFSRYSNFPLTFQYLKIIEPIIGKLLLQ